MKSLPSMGFQEKTSKLARGIAQSIYILSGEGHKLPGIASATFSHLSTS